MPRMLQGFAVHTARLRDFAVPGEGCECCTQTLEADKEGVSKREGMYVLVQLVLLARRADNGTAKEML